MCDKINCKFYEEETNACMGGCATNPKIYVVVGNETIGLCSVDNNKKSTALGIYPAYEFGTDGLIVSIINYYCFETYGEDFDAEAEEIQYLYDNAELVTDEEFVKIVS